MSRKNGSIKLLLIIFAFTTILLPMWACSTVINNNFILNVDHKGTFLDSPDTMDLKSSANGDPLSYSSIFRNSTSAYRLFESIKFAKDGDWFKDCWINIQDSNIQGIFITQKIKTLILLLYLII